MAPTHIQAAKDGLDFRERAAQATVGPRVSVAEQAFGKFVLAQPVRLRRRASRTRRADPFNRSIIHLSLNRR